MRLLFAALLLLGFVWASPASASHHRAHAVVHYSDPNFQE